MSLERYITSLVKLLEDEDPFVSESAYQRLLDFEVDAIPVILKFREGASERLRNMLDEVVSTLKIKKYTSEVISYFRSDDGDIEQGAFLVAKFAYPEVNFKEYSEILDLMAFDLRKRIYGKDDLFEIIESVNKFFFVEKGFRGNFEDYYDPDNIFINRVLDRRLGIPITLSLVYILVGRRANLPVYGVGIPWHFVVRYELNGFEIYVDPFNKGRLMTRDECEKLISQMGYAQKQEYFSRASPREMVKRMFEDLILAYKNKGYFEGANKLIEVIKLIEVV